LASFFTGTIRVARWYVFKPKILILVSFVGPWNEKSWYILWPFGIHYINLVFLRPLGNLVAIWYIFPCFGILNEEKSGNPGHNTASTEGLPGGFDFNRD
jgi:hypothetical protein